MDITVWGQRNKSNHDFVENITILAVLSHQLDRSDCITRMYGQ